MKVENQDKTDGERNITGNRSFNQQQEDRTPQSKNCMTKVENQGKTDGERNITGNRSFNQQQEHHTPKPKTA
jgi:beta-galactosidase beta subunit